MFHYSHPPLIERIRIIEKECELPPESFQEGIHPQEKNDENQDHSKIE